VGVIRVVVVDDDAFVRQGLRMVLNSAADVEVVGEADDGAGALEAADRHRPDVVIMDIRMPGVDGIAATARLRAAPRPPRVLVLTTFDLDRYVLDALRAGASGFLLKDAGPQDILEAVRVVAAGNAMLAPTATRALVERYADPAQHGRSDAARRSLDALAEREREVAELVARGMSNAQIGADLHLTEATVKAYVSRVLAKLDLENRVQIALVVRDAES
jgi:DNA-binding NarL/FixJ family response regulator